MRQNYYWNAGDKPPWNTTVIKLFVNGFLGVVLLLGLTYSGIVTAKFQSPLLMAGKKTLYQRVLARPDAYMHSQPTSRAGQTYAVAPFTIFYVYERKRVEEVEWVKVGHEKRNKTLGWIPADKLIDWKQNGDPYFYENHHLSPQPIEESRSDGGDEYWIFYDSLKFSGKKLVVSPGSTYRTTDAGVYNLLVLTGSGRFGGLEVRGGDPDHDELFVTCEAAQRGIEVQNTSKEDLVLVKFFGPDVNSDVPMIGRR